MLRMNMPPLLKSFFRRWRALAVKLGHFNGLVLLTILYWMIIGLIGACFRLFRQDPLGRRARQGSFYHPKGLAARSVADYQHLY
jgi:hypothetical protein